LPGSACLLYLEAASNETLHGREAVVSDRTKQRLETWCALVEPLVEETIEEAVRTREVVEARGRREVVANLKNELVGNRE
jgi:hypothetical protein